MAMFLNGLEENPNQWSGWTFSGIAKCGHHLYLSGGGQNDKLLQGVSSVASARPVSSAQSCCGVTRMTR